MLYFDIYNIESSKNKIKLNLKQKLNPLFSLIEYNINQTKQTL